MLNVKTFMAFLLIYVEMDLGTYYSKWLKRQNRAYRPDLYLSASGPENGEWEDDLACGDDEDDM